MVIASTTAYAGEKALNWEKKFNHLDKMQCHVLGEAGTEKPFTSPLLHEKREGVYVCAACRHPLFLSNTKYESGSGWPSFYKPIKGAFKTSIDRKYVMVRTEYSCANCGGHHGHVFEDGPQPTGQRYCNNGVSLKFIPKEEYKGYDKLLEENK